MIDTITHTVAATSALMTTAFIQPQTEVLAQRHISLNNRYAVPSVNEVFKDNILLNMAYMSERVKDNKNIRFEEVKHPFHYEMTLQPNQSFAYHEDVLPQYKGTISKTTNAHFNALEGFKSDGYLVGDGVCHLASLINWVAKDGGLEVYAPANHDFAAIPEIPREYAIAIYNQPGSPYIGAMQNLYIKNNKSKAIRFVFEYNNDVLKLTLVEAV